MFSKTFDFVKNIPLDDLAKELERHGVIFEEESPCENFVNISQGFEYITPHKYHCYFDLERTFSCDVQASTASAFETKFGFVVSENKMTLSRLTSQELIGAA